jgi:hypothetical protein
MAEWNGNPSWTPKEQINGGQQFTPDDILSPEDFNALVENMQYLYENGGDFEVNPYPIGAVYMSFEATSPASLFGGGWTQLKSKFLLGADTDALTNPIPTYKGTTEGGSADAVVVEHRHQGIYWGDISENYITLNTEGGAAYGLSYGASDNSNIIYTGREGVDGTGKNMPPYQVVYMWRRIS